MFASFVYTPTFHNWWQKLGLDDDALRELEQVLLKAPASGSVMSGTGGLRKIRFAPSSFHRGKSGAIRVCYVWFEEYSILFVALAFTKNVQANLTSTEKNQYRKYIEDVRKSLIVSRKRP